MYSYKNVYRLLKQKHEILIHATTWVNLEIILLSERSQRQVHTVWFYLYVISILLLEVISIYVAY